MKGRQATRSSLAAREQSARVAVFPDLRNMGVLARALIVYIMLAVGYGFAQAAAPADVVMQVLVAIGASLPVAGGLAVFWLLAAPWLRQLAYWQAAGLLGLIGLLLVVGLAPLLAFPLWRAAPLTLLALVVVLAYFHTLGQARSPAVTEARLQALQARIRPHFLFNALNAVLGILRTDPRRAEAALEDLAELFRVLMRENRELRSLHDEIVLTRQYLDLEKLRLGSRLNVVWKLERMPRDVLIPPLVLQPLAENAVYHGIEPHPGPGEIEIEVTAQRGRVTIWIRNPFIEKPGQHHGGNKMAMNNIRERLALHFDAEAELVAGPREGRYQVRLSIPLRRSTDHQTAL